MRASGPLVGNAGVMRGPGFPERGGRGAIVCAGANIKIYTANAPVPSTYAYVLEYHMNS